jgi:5-methylcytosine-specific restriction endonuclease McrA
VGGVVVGENDRRERDRERKRRYVAANREKVAAQRKAYRQANAEKIAAADRTYRLANMDAARDQMRKWRAANPGKHAEYQRRYTAANPELNRQRVQAWREANPERAAEHARAQWHVRRARIAALYVERVERSVVWLRDDGRCHLCGEPCDPDDWHLDHVIPLAADGPHCYPNTAVAHPACNRSKNASVVDSPLMAAAMVAFDVFHAVRGVLVGQS